MILSHSCIVITPSPLPCWSREPKNIRMGADFTPVLYAEKSTLPLRDNGDGPGSKPWAWIVGHGATTERMREVAGPARRAPAAR